MREVNEMSIVTASQKLSPAAHLGANVESQRETALTELGRESRAASRELTDSRVRGNAKLDPMRGGLIPSFTRSLGMII
jgi:hypothetical protein